MNTRNDKETLRRITRYKHYVIVRLPTAWFAPEVKAIVAYKVNDEIVLRPVK